jgi:hypothetical protein
MFMTIENLQKTNLPNREKSREMIEKEIQEKLKLYHTTTKEKWEKIQEVGAILSERELVKRGLITTTQLDDFETTSTGIWIERKIETIMFLLAIKKKIMAMLPWRLI